MTVDQNGTAAEQHATEVRERMDLEVVRLRRQVQQERERRQQLDLEFETFKEQVVDVATRYGEAHGWCSVMDEALRELGLEPLTAKEHSFDVIVRISMTATPSNKRREMDESFVRSCLTLGDIEIHGDGDLADWSVDSSEIEDIENVEPVE